MATNLLNKVEFDFYGPSGGCVASGILTLVSGSAPTLTEMQGVTFTSRTSAGVYLLNVGRIGAKQLTVIVTPSFGTLGIGAQSSLINPTTGAFTLSAFTTSTGVAVETSGIQLHFMVIERMSS